MNIFGNIVTLRSIEKKDLPLLQKWSNDPEVQYWLGGWHTPTSEIVMENWLSRISNDNLNLRLAIDHHDIGLVGTANLVDINFKDRNAFHGMFIGEKDVRGTGIGVDVVFAIMRYAFEELGLNRLDGSIIEYNSSSLKLYEGCGWKQEGLLREWYWRKNRYWNKLLVGITREEYMDLIERKKYWR
jgi:RimJ/RimL family protein N-acetyltransferase